MTVLNTRIYKPEVAEPVLLRERIVSLLEKNKRKPLTLVIAGAGYGKSLAISHWLDQTGQKNCWICLEQDCNDMRIFLSYLHAAINSILPGSLLQISDIIKSEDLPPMDVIIPAFINDIALISEELRIVLDDYHVIHNQDIHQLLERLLRYPLKYVKLIIISRYDPPMKLSTLKAYGKVNELRMSDLRFSLKEIMDLSSKLSLESVQEDQAKMILEKSEGWIIGIRLLLKDMLEIDDRSGSLSKEHLHSDGLAEYLLDELFGKQPVSVQKGLTQAALFNRFSLELVEKVNLSDLDISKLEAREIVVNLNYFIERSMFIFSLDDIKKWYRFHHLIQEFLLSRAKEYYTDEVIELMYLRASNYFESSDFFEEAIECALHGNNIDVVVRIIDSNTDKLFQKDEFNRVKLWLSMLPAGTTENYASLLLIKARFDDSYADYHAWDYDLKLAFALMQPLDEMSEPSKKLWGNYYALKAGLSYFTGDTGHSLEFADKALELLPEAGSYFKDYAFFMKSISLQNVGRAKEAIEVFKKHQTMIQASNRFGLLTSHGLLSIVYLYEADLEEILRSSNLAYEISLEENSWQSHLMASYFLANIHYIQNDLDKVEPYIQSVREHSLSGRPMWVAHTLLLGAFYYLTTGQNSKFSRIISDIKIVLQKYRMKQFSDLAFSIEVELALRQGNLELANQMSEQTRFSSIPIVFSFYFTQLTKVKLLMARADKESMNDGKKLLDKYIQYGESYHNANLLIQVYSLMALWFEKTGDAKHALEYLRKALHIGRRGRYLRTFADLGGEMEHLLKKLNESEKQDHYIQDVMQIFNHDKNINRSVLKQKKSTFYNRKDTGLEISAKELEILKLVAEGYQNKEIADKLSYSLDTIKKYLYIIYQKLGVKNRTSAVSMVQELELIQTHSNTHLN